MGNNKNLKYVWWVEGHSFSTNQIFNTEEDARKAAMDMYRNDVANENYFNFDYNNDQLKPIVIIGTIECLDLDDMTNSLFMSLLDDAKDYLYNFAFHCENEPEFDGTTVCDQEVKNVLRKWLDNCYINPQMLGVPLYEFDCKSGSIINNEQSC